VAPKARIYRLPALSPFILWDICEQATQAISYEGRLIDASVGDGESLAAICIWLFERDNGGLALPAATLICIFDRSPLRLAESHLPPSSP
jgi:hypothetical protein